ncbi:MAG TPA: hypothetical protein VJM51_09080 [Dehalococcoidia bacterium]|nr:hypothetical protein [Dehalococcoidia bacterium]
MTTLPKWCTPERQRRMVEIFGRTLGLCVYGHPQCSIEAHCYEAYLDEQLIPDWIGMDASQRNWELKMERERLHAIPDRKGWGKCYEQRYGVLHRWDPVSMEQWWAAQPMFEIMGYSVNPLTMHKTALVRIPGEIVRLLVDVEQAVNPSKHQIRRAKRAGERLPTAWEMCEAVVLDWQANN